MKLKLTLAAILLCCLSNISFAQNEMGEQRISKNLTYGKDNIQRLDLFLAPNANPNAPFVIFIHGGNFLNGNKGDDAGMMRNLMKLGISGVSINYHLLPAGIANETTYRTMLNDVWDAIGYCQLNANSWNVRNSGYTTIGAGAGGMLALLSAYKFPELVRNTVGLGAFTDLSAISDFKNQSELGNYKTILKKLTKENMRYGDKVPKDIIDASPIYQFRNIPTLLIAGTKDAIVPYSQSMALHDMMKEQGFISRFVAVNNRGNDLGYAQDEAIQQEVDGEIAAWLRM